MAENVDIRVRLQGARQAASDADRVAASLRRVSSSSRSVSASSIKATKASSGMTTAVGRLGNASKTTAATTAQASKSSGALSGALGGIGMSAAAAGGPLVAAGVAAAAVAVAVKKVAVTGVQFNATMEQNKIALEGFLGSADKADAYLEDLYNISKKGPFEFPQLAAAAKKMLGFGMSAKTTRGWMLTLSDTVAGVGGNAEQIDRAVIALGQMQAKGKVSQEEMNQLTEAGIPAQKILQESLKLTKKEMGNLGNAGISAAKALPALKKGFDKKFGGASQKQSKTLIGQWSTLKDNFAQASGAVAAPLGALAKVVFPAMNKALEQVVPFVKGLAAAFGGKLVKKTTDASRAGGKFAVYIKAMIVLMKPWIDGFKQSWAISMLLWKVLFKVAGFVAKVGTALVKWMMPGIRTMIKLRDAFFKATNGITILKKAFGLIATVVKAVLPVIVGIGTGFWSVISNISKLLWAIAKVIWNAFGRPWLKVLVTVLRPLASFVKTVLVGAFKLLSPVFKFVLKRAGAFISGLKAQFTGVGRTLAGIWDPLKTGFEAVIKGIQGAWNALAKSPFGKKAGLDVWGDTQLGAGPGAIPGGGIPSNKRAGGGLITQAGRVLVGERGPEILSLPASARVTPMSRPQAAAGGGVFDVNVPVHIDGRVVARAVGRATLAKHNRR